jgi:MFS transporter, PAT family, beta-lactamase induction signal transducer AmpG
MKFQSTSAKLLLLGALYLSQGLPFGFFTQALPVMMRQSGRSLEAIGLTSLLALPWALKFLWAPWVDRHRLAAFGRRKSWIVPLQLGTALVLALSAWVTPQVSLGAVFSVVLLINALSATQDIATDGLAVELLEAHERGLANGLQVAGYRLGMVLGGGVILIFFSRLGWHSSFLAMSGLVLLATVPIVLFREQDTLSHVEAEPLGEAVHFLKLSGAWPLLALLFLFKFGEALAAAMLRPFLTDHALSLEDIGWLLGTVGFLASFLGAMFGGFLSGTLARRTALQLGALAQVVTLALYVWMASRFPDKPMLAVIVGIEHFGSSVATAALFTCMMDWSRKTHSGSDYTVQASTVVIASGVAASFSGFSARHLGYSGHFTLSLILTAAAWLAVVRWFPTKAPHEPRPSA